jgi:MFS family permease
MTDSDTPRGRGPALAVASAGYFFVLLDVTIVNVALARIGSGLGGSRSELQWVVDAYALVLAAGMLGAGDLADRTGSRRLFLAGLLAFGGASALCAAAPSAAVLIAARAIQGLGAAAILPSSLAIVNQLFPDPAERPKAIGVWAGLGGSALVLGPILGGLLVGPLGWRAISWLNVPLVIAALIGGLLTLPEGAKAKAARPDWAGQALGTTALAALVFALIEGGKSGFASAPALAGIAVALVTFVGFIAVERRLSAGNSAATEVPALFAPLIAARGANRAGTTGAAELIRRSVDSEARTTGGAQEPGSGPTGGAQGSGGGPTGGEPVAGARGTDRGATDGPRRTGGAPTRGTRVADGGSTGEDAEATRPLLDLGWFRRPEFTGANAGAGLMNLGTLGGLFALGLFLQEGEGLSPLEAGLALVPLALPLAALTPFTGRLVGRVGPRLPAGLGLAMSGVGYLGTALVGSSHIDTPIGWAFLFVAGAGMGVAVPGLVAGATEALGPDRAGIASAVNNTSRQVGGAIGVALIGGLSSISTSLIFSAVALLLGGLLAGALMGGCGAKPSLCDGKAPHALR